MKKIKNSLLIGIVALVGLMASGLNGVALPLYLGIRDNYVTDERSVQKPTLDEIINNLGISGHIKGEKLGFLVNLGEYKNDETLKLIFDRPKEGKGAVEVKSSIGTLKAASFKVKEEAAAVLIAPTTDIPETSIRLKDVKVIPQLVKGKGYILNLHFTLVDK